MLTTDAQVRKLMEEMSKHGPRSSGIPLHFAPSADLKAAVVDRSVPSVAGVEWPPSSARSILGLMASSVSRAHLHRLLNELPTDELRAVQRFLQFLRGLKKNDPVLRALERAPLDDEPELPAEAAAVRQARQAVRKGRALSTTALRRSLRL